MPQADAVPAPTTIADGEVLTDSHRLMVGHREEAQRTLDRELKAGLPPRFAFAMRGRAIRAASRLRLPRLAGPPFATA